MHCMSSLLTHAPPSQHTCVHTLLLFLLQVNSLPSMALYDRREGKWRGESGAEGTVIDYINFATQGKLQDGM